MKMLGEGFQGVILLVLYLAHGTGAKREQKMLLDAKVYVAETPVAAGHETILATCEVRGTPPFQLRWDVDQLDFIRTEQISSETKDGEGKDLVLLNLIGLATREMNKRVIRCLVRHPTLSEDMVISHQIAVLYPPQSVRIVQLSETAIECQADSNPEPTHYSWTRDGQQLNITGARIEGSNLLNGVYFCEVINSYGSARNTGAFTQYSVAEKSEHGVPGCLGIAVLILFVAIGVVAFWIHRNKALRGMKGAMAKYPM